MESLNHVFRLCPVSQMVWRGSWLGIVSVTQNDIRLEDWIMNFLNVFFNQDGDDDDRLLQFISICWSIWLHRNDIFFRNVSASPEAILLLSQVHVQKWKQARDLLELRESEDFTKIKPNGQDGVMVYKVGRCIHGSFISVVVEAAWKALHKAKRNQWQAAIGWEEDTSQEPRVRGAARVFAYSPLQAECQAILRGTIEAASMASNVVIKTNFLEAVQAIKNPSLAAAGILTIIEDIRKEATNIQYFVCIKVNRNQVTKAHNLAHKERLGN